MINVTKTYLPNKAKYIRYIDEIYKNNWVTNDGPILKRLEEKLADYLGVKNLILVANGTVALEIAYRTLDIKGYAITTPFSFVATTSSLVTNGIKPIFVDINHETLNIAHQQIENAITPNTSALVPVHVFGNGCEIDEIEKIAKKHKLKVIYDAAHAFNVKYNMNSILNYGNISTLSFHATKLFHSIEGGALIINDDSLAEKARYLINFGIAGPESIPHLGTNAKMNELEAAMGLCMLDEIDTVIEKREVIYDKYTKDLSSIVEFQEKNINSSSNFSYFPILLKNENSMLKVQRSLNEKSIYPRRYFYPSLDTLSYIEPKQLCPVSREVSKKILCLPLYPELKIKEQQLIIDTIRTHTQV